MLCGQRDGCRCNEESHVELRQQLEDTKRELQRLKSREEKPVSPSDAETLGREKTLGPLTSTDGLEMFKVGPQTDASCGGSNQRCDSKMLSFIEQANTLQRELDILLKERRIIEPSGGAANPIPKQRGRCCRQSREAEDGDTLQGDIQPEVPHAGAPKRSSSSAARRSSG